jgi:hypothetical protein
MNDIQKWNPATHKYEPYEVPDGILLPLYSEDMTLITQCAECFKELHYGDSYTSKFIHNHIGLGYPVCEECNLKEFSEVASD